jgi:aspartate/methionine/tyrosine aminotransferase
MSNFENSAVNLPVLRERAFNGRWAVIPEDVIPLTAADPDFPVAPPILEAMHAYLRAGYLNYGPFCGLDSFKVSVATHFNTRKGCQFEPRHVLAVNSAASGMQQVLQAMIQPGDEAIIMDPVDFLFKTTVEAVGGRPILWPVADDGLDVGCLQALITPRTKIICLCNPHNPLGRVFTLPELQSLAALAESHGIWILSDEIWSDVVYDNREFVSFSAVSDWAAEHSFTVYGFSKTFGLAGLRIGAILCANEARLEQLITRAGYQSTIEGVSTLSQIAASAALDHAWPWAQDFVAHLQQNRDLALEMLNQSDFFTTQKPQGTFVLFPRLNLEIDSTLFADRLLQVGKVAVVPGAARWFGPGAKGHFRLCLSTSREILSTGINRILEATCDWQP